MRALAVARRMWLVEWRYGYRSARRDGWSRRRAARMWARELRKAVRDFPDAVRERNGW
jgi:hypothetical protein